MLNMEDNKLRELVDRMVEFGDWGVITQLFNQLDYNFIEEHKYAFDWRYISSNLYKFEIKDWMWSKYEEFFNWEDISRQKLDEDFVDKYAHKLNWRDLLQSNNFSESFIIEHLRYVDLDMVVSTQYISEDFLWEFRDAFNWKYIWSELSPEFMRKAVDYIDWTSFGWNKLFTEDIMREFSDCFDWDILSHKQTMSEQFVRENWDKINFQYLLLNEHCCFRRSFVKEFVREKLSRLQVFVKRDAIRKRYDNDFYNELIKMKNYQENYHV